MLKNKSESLIFVDAPKSLVQSLFNHIAAEISCEVLIIKIKSSSRLKYLFFNWKLGQNEGRKYTMRYDLRILDVIDFCKIWYKRSWKHFCMQTPPIGIKWYFIGFEKIPFYVKKNCSFDMPYSISIWIHKIFPVAFFWLIKIAGIQINFQKYL